jgi:hypothetical protein
LSAFHWTLAAVTEQQVQRTASGIGFGVFAVAIILLVILAAIVFGVPWGRKRRADGGSYLIGFMLCILLGPLIVVVSLVYFLTVGWLLFFTGNDDFLRRLPRPSLIGRDASRRHRQVTSTHTAAALPDLDPSPGAVSNAVQAQGTMYCPMCGAFWPEGYLHCGNCGAQTVAPLGSSGKQPLLD